MLFCILDEMHSTICIARLFETCQRYLQLVMIDWQQYILFDFFLLFVFNPAENVYVSLRIFSQSSTEVLCYFQFLMPSEKLRSFPCQCFFSFRNWCIFQINSVVMPGTKEEKALPLKFSSLRKKVCLGHHPISHRPWRIDQKCWTVDESEMKRADERAEENRSRRGCIIYLKP